MSLLCSPGCWNVVDTDDADDATGGSLGGCFHACPQYAELPVLAAFLPMAFSFPVAVAVLVGSFSFAIVESDIR